MNFGGIDKKYSDYDLSKIIVYPIPFRNSFFSSSNSASEILDASQSLELYEEETDTEVYKIGIHTLSDTDSTHNSIYQKSKQLISEGKFVCAIGENHSISLPLIQAHSEKFYDLSILQIDSRPNLRNKTEFDEDSSDSVMNQVTKKLKIPLVQFGIQTISVEEAILVDENPLIKLFWAKDIFRKQDLIDDVIKSLTADVYLSIDVSAFCSSLMSTKQVSQPGGLEWFEVLNLIHRVAEKRRIVGMDLVEYYPTESHNSAAFFCAKLIYKFLAYIFKDDNPKVRQFRI